MNNNNDDQKTTALLIDFIDNVLIQPIVDKLVGQTLNTQQANITKKAIGDRLEQHMKHHHG